MTVYKNVPAFEPARTSILTAAACCCFFNIHEFVWAQCNPIQSDYCVPHKFNGEHG